MNMNIQFLYSFKNEWSMLDAKLFISFLLCQLHELLFTVEWIFSFWLIIFANGTKLNNVNFNDKCKNDAISPLVHFPIFTFFAHPLLFRSPLFMFRTDCYTAIQLKNKINRNNITRSKKCVLKKDEKSERIQNK